MKYLEECQIPGLSRVSEGKVAFEKQSIIKTFKRSIARPWNYYIKTTLKRIDRFISRRISGTSNQSGHASNMSVSESSLQAGDWVRVRSRGEIEPTLDRWKELHGCAFLEYMWQYCDTTQQVLQVMERFLDERDYKVKRVKGLVLLKDVICHGTPVFGRCDRCCHLFWRVEWLEKVPAP
jgi:hypothetical protein